MSANFIERIGVATAFIVEKIRREDKCECGERKFSHDGRHEEIVCPLHSALMVLDLVKKDLRCSS